MNLGPFDQLSKVLLHREHLLAIQRKDYLPPVSVKIELTNVCNHDCHFCAYRKIVQEPKIKDMLDTDRTIQLIDELAAGGVRSVMFTGGGEPLLHPAIDRFLARCQEKHLQYAIITNGIRLGKVADELLAGLKWIRFSINAGTPEQYADVHGVPARQWDTAWEQVYRAAQKAQFPGVTVGVSCVVTTRNMAHMEALALQAKSAGASYIHFRPAFEGPHTELEEQLSPQEIAGALDALAQLSYLENEHFKVHGIVDRFNEIEHPAKQHIHCKTTPLIAYILPTGDISICTVVRDNNFHPDVANSFLGNIYRHRFFDVWNSAFHHDLIHRLSNANCKRCHFSKYNMALDAVTSDSLHASFL